jgi:hypothetical protein
MRIYLEGLYYDNTPYFEEQYTFSSARDSVVDITKTEKSFIKMSMPHNLDSSVVQSVGLRIVLEINDLENDTKNLYTGEY